MSLDIAYLDMYKQLGTEEDEKKEKKTMARILRVWNTEYDIVQPAHVDQNKSYRNFIIIGLV